MKPCIAILGMLIAMTGCITHPKYQKPIEQVEIDYRLILNDMAKQEVIAKLGIPDRIGGREYRWWRDQRMGPTSGRHLVL